MKWLYNHPRLHVILIAFNVALGAVNVASAVAFPGYFSWTNWLVAGFCLGTASCLPTIHKLKQLAEDQTNSLIASNAAMEAMSPANMRTMLQGALLSVIEQMKKEGTLPPEIQITLADDELPKSYH